LSKPGAFVPLILVILLLLFAGIFALTQEKEEDLFSDDFDPAELALDIPDGEQEPPPEWIPPGPPRWFRSNAGGMMLAEVPSRLAALRNTYALVVDYVAPSELDERLASFYHDDYTVEVRILYDQGKESRRQWLLRDKAGVTRLNAVFRPPREESEEQPEERSAQTLSQETPDDEQPVEEPLAEELLQEESLPELADAQEITEETEIEIAAADPPPNVPMPDLDSPDEVSTADEAGRVGFIELYNSKAQIVEDRTLFDNDTETHIVYIYNRNTLVQAETYQKLPDLSPVKWYTDNYRYNRSFSLRQVERLYHEGKIAEPIRLTFPNRVLQAVSNQTFLSDKLYVRSDFLGNFVAGEGFRMKFDTDSKGRIITQTLIDSDNKTVWVIRNTWSGDRIVTILKTEDKDEKRVEYEYDKDGNRMVQRDIHNGVLERMVRAEGEIEIEELFLNGVVVLRAHWEDGRKIFEERVRRQ
jgi:hypothetical protein